jgi:non-canonical purine NTP pyrophosphatase (RdgB/HAM1 family)
MDPIVIATGNPHKVQELRAIFALKNITILGLNDLPGTFQEPTESGGTFEANATIKALSYADQTGRVCLADDSGLEVDALNGAPGVISSHYSSGGKETGLSRADRDAANNQKLLNDLAGVPPIGRNARFVCVMCLAAPSCWLESSPNNEGVEKREEPGGIGLWPVPRSDSDASEQNDPVPEARNPLHSVGSELSRKRRTLPHWQRGGRTYFVTFNVQSGRLSPKERAIVLSACLFWHPVRVRIHIAVIMPDHVHLLMTPLPDPAGGWYSLSKLLHSIKGFSSREVNSARGVEGTFWQPESFDRIVRDHNEFEEKRRYIWLNPVRAGLADRPANYPFLVRPLWGREDSERAQALLCAQQTKATGHRPEAYATWPLALSEPPLNPVLSLTRGTFEGRIGLPGEVPRGDHGFGYDPLFLLPAPDTRSSAELPPEEKNRLSHRAAAAALMAQRISELF